MNFVDLMQTYRVPMKAPGEHHHTNTGWIQLDCPQCSPNSGKFRLGYNVRGRYVSCWTCGRVQLIDVLAHYTKLPTSQCCLLLEGLPREQTPFFAPHVGKLEEPNGLGELTIYHCDYLEARGFDVAKVEAEWGIRAITQNALFHLRWRVYIPIHFRGEIVSWTTRAISSEAKRRYYSAQDAQSAIRPSDLLYGIDHCRNTAVIVEGPLDVWAVGYGAVSALGIRFSPAQLEQLSRIPVRVICLDSQPIAQARARHLCDQLAVYDGSTYNITLDSGKDPAEADPEELTELRQRFQMER